MGRGGGQVFSGPGPVQTPPEIIEDITAEELDIRQLREDMRLNHVVIGSSAVFLAFEGGWSNQLDGEQHAPEDQIGVPCYIEGFGTPYLSLLAPLLSILGFQNHHRGPA